MHLSSQMPSGSAHCWAMKGLAQGDISERILYMWQIHKSN